MKKSLIVLAALAVLSGCGMNEKTTCTNENKVGNINYITNFLFIGFRPIKMNTFKYIVLDLLNQNNFCEV